jgi:hypothetical protein
VSVLVSPDRRVTVAGKEYTLDGSFRTLKAIQHGFGKEIIGLWGTITAMAFDDLARLIALGIEGSGGKAPAPEVIEQEIVEEIGIDDTRALLVEWLLIAMSPKRDREKKARLMAEVRERSNKASRGPSTRSSA